MKNVTIRIWCVLRKQVSHTLQNFINKYQKLFNKFYKKLLNYFIPFLRKLVLRNDWFFIYAKSCIRRYEYQYINLYFSHLNIMFKILIAGLFIFMFDIMFAYILPLKSAIFFPHILKMIDSCHLLNTYRNR